MKLNLGSIQIPLNAATKTFALLAKRGAGKTYAGCVLAEEFYKNNIPFVVFDPIDVWWGLRLNKDGKSKGLPIVVFGLKNADIPLDRDMGRKIAQAVVKDNVSCVISTYGLPKVAERHLIAEFSEELLNINNTPRHIFIEEASEFVPQRVFGAMGRTYAAVERLVKMGRNVGLGVTLINQRAATVNKDVLTQLDALLAFQNNSPQDRKALQDWVEYHSAEGDFDKFMRSLPFLQKGEGWIWSPELGYFERIKIRKRETFHPDREKMGQFKMPELDQIDVQDFISRFSKTIEKPKEIKEGKRLKEKQEIIQAQPDNQTIIQLKNEYESKLLQKDVEIRKVGEKLEQIRRIIGSENTMVSGLPATYDTVTLWQSKLGNGLAGKVFRFLSENPMRQFTREQICLAIGVPSKAGHTSNEFGKVMRTGAVIRNGHLYQLNPNL